MFSRRGPPFLKTVTDPKGSRRYHDKQEGTRPASEYQLLGFRVPPHPEKVRLRDSALAARERLTGADREIKNRAIARSLNALPEIRGAGMIMSYASFRSEVDTYAMMSSWLEEGKRVAVPIAEKKATTLIPSEILHLPDDLAPGAYGVPEPKADRWRVIDLSSVEAVLVPGVVFDVSGHRIGYGMGFYDRFIGAVSGRFPFIGLAFDCQVVERVPPERHDRAVDIVVTETRVIRVAAGRKSRGTNGS